MTIRERINKWYWKGNDYFKDNQQKWRRKNPEKVILERARNKAKKRGLEFNLELSDIHIPEKCPYFDVPLEFKGAIYDYAPSLDRVDNSKGYIKGNVEVISYLANRMKNNADFETLVKFAEAILKRRKT